MADIFDAIEEENILEIVLLLPVQYNAIKFDTNGKFLISVPMILCQYDMPLFLSQAIDLGADIHTKNHTDTYAIHMAVTYSLECTEILINRGADCNVLDIDGYSPLYYAIHNQEHGFDITKLLLKNGANPHEKKSLFLEACQARNLDLIKLYTKITKNIHVTDPEGYTALHNVLYQIGISQQETIQCVEYLLSIGIDPDIKDGYGHSALKISQMWEEHELVKILSNPQAYIITNN